jgi:hypothetical protein
LDGFESQILRQGANMLILRHLLGVIRFGALRRLHFDAFERDPSA